MVPYQNALVLESELITLQSQVFEEASELVMRLSQASENNHSAEFQVLSAGLLASDTISYSAWVTGSVFQTNENLYDAGSGEYERASPLIGLTLMDPSGQEIQVTQHSNISLHTRLRIRTKFIISLIITTEIFSPGGGRQCDHSYSRDL